MVAAGKNELTQADGLALIRRATAEHAAAINLITVCGMIYILLPYFRNSVLNGCPVISFLTGQNGCCRCRTLCFIVVGVFFFIFIFKF
jgi:hypothetical protein